MKKQLLSIFAAISVSTMLAQVPAAVWATNQDAIYPSAVTSSGVKFMDAVDANVVWVIGRDYANTRNYNWFSRTTNGGTSFTGGNVYSDTNTYIIANMEAIDANTAWVSAYMKASQGMGAIHRTTNGGANWVNMTATGMYTNTAAFANWVTFLTPNVGIANGDPVNGEYELWRTTNGGLSWTPVPGANIPNPLSGEFAIVNLYAKVGTSNVWFGTNGNRMFRSTDAGINWNVSTVGVATNIITEIAFSSPNNGVCYTFNGGTNATELYNTFDGGVTWAQISVSSTMGLFDVVGVPGTGNLVSFGASTGNELVSYSTDNGVTWIDFGSTGIPYITGDFVDGSTGWAGSFELPGAHDVWKFSGVLTGTAVPVAAFTIPTDICLSGNSAVITPTNSSVGSPSLTYNWSVSPAATLSSITATNPTITFNSANIYTVTLVASNSVGTNTTSWVVNVIACTAPVASFTLPAQACSNFSFTPGNTSTGAPTPGYLWSVSPAANVTIAPSVAGTNPGIRIGTAGIYSITLLVTNASGTAQTTQTLNVTSCPPVVSFTIPQSFQICDAIKTFSTVQGTTNPLGASGSITYTWSVSPSTGLSYAPNLFSPNLKVTITNTTISSYTVTLRARNASGTSTLTQMIYADCVGITERNLLADNLIVFPNPAHEQITVTVPGSVDTYKVKLTNILGSVVFEEKNAKNSKENTVINLSNKAKGVYFLTVESNNEKVTKKIVVE